MKREKREYICSQCGYNETIIIPQKTKYLLYCANCGTYIATVGYKEAIERYKRLAEHPEILGDKYALKKHEKKKMESDGKVIKRMVCSNCKTLLYDSSRAPPLGQFNLVKAKYCPQCGRMLL